MCLWLCTKSDAFFHALPFFSFFFYNVELTCFIFSLLPSKIDYWKSCPTRRSATSSLPLSHRTSNWWMNSNIDRSWHLKLSKRQKLEASIRITERKKMWVRPLTSTCISWMAIKSYWQTPVLVSWKLFLRIIATVHVRNDLNVYVVAECQLLCVYIILLVSNSENGPRGHSSLSVSALANHGISLK